MRTIEDIDEATKHHPPSHPSVAEMHEEVRERCKDLMIWLLDSLPEVPERTIALNKVREAMMYANAVVAIHQVG